MLNLLKIKKNLEEFSFREKHNSIDFKYNTIKIVGDVKHNIPSIKEWSNNNYSYNKTNFKYLAIQNKLAEKLIKSYFCLTPIYKLGIENTNVSKNVALKQVKLMNKYSRIMRKSLNKILVGKPDIKHLGSKIIINIAMFNKEKYSILRKISLLEKSLLDNSNYFFNFLLRNNNLILPKINTLKSIHNLKVSSLNDKSKYFRKLINEGLNNTKYKKITSNKVLNKKLNYRFGFNKFSYSKINLFEEKLVFSILNKKTFIKNLFLYSFLKWTLFLFNIKVSLFKHNMDKWLIIKGKETNFFILNKHIGLNDLKKINHLLLSLILNTKELSKTFKLNSLFNYFKAQYFVKFMKRYLKKQIASLNQLYNISINNFKLDKFVLDLELILRNVFNKEVELNIINTKYIHLNSNLLTEAIATKLRNKTSRLLLVMKRSLKLVKLPIKSYNSNSKSTSTFLNKYKNFKIISFFEESLNKNNTLKTLYSKDKLSIFLNKIFKNNSIEKDKMYSFNDKYLKQKKILNIIKNKWVKGIKIEAKGRLTKRYTASRSVFKSKYIGNLRMIDYKLNNLKSNMVRGDLKLNMDYSFKNSFKRIGSFGIKGWISTN